MSTLISCEHIKISIGSTIIKENFSIHFSAGDVLIITGSNGSGKSTLLRYLCGSYFHRGIHLNGTPSKLMNITGGFDKYLSAIENLVVFGHRLKLINKSQPLYINKILETANLSQDILPLKTSQLSHGTVMRLAFAISYLYSKNRDFMVMDEWLSVGDLSFKAKANELLRELVSDYGKGLILATNSLPPKLSQNQVILDLDKSI